MLKTIEVVYVKDLTEDDSSKKRYYINTESDVRVGELVREVVDGSYKGTTMKVTQELPQVVEHAGGIEIKTLVLGQALRTLFQWAESSPLEKEHLTKLYELSGGEIANKGELVRRSDFQEKLKGWIPELPETHPVHASKWY